MSLYRAVVLRWIDGDTLDAEVDLRHGLKRHVRVRMAGVAAPETRGPQRALGIATKQWVELQVPAGSPIALEDYGELEEDAFGRWLCRVAAWPAHPDVPVDVGATMIREGYAVPYEDRKTIDWAAITAWPMRGRKTP